MFLQSRTSITDIKKQGGSYGELMDAAPRSPCSNYFHAANHLDSEEHCKDFSVITVKFYVLVSFSKYGVIKHYYLCLQGQVF